MPTSILPNSSPPLRAHRVAPQAVKQTFDRYSLWSIDEYPSVLIPFFFLLTRRNQHRATYPILPVTSFNYTEIIYHVQERSLDHNWNFDILFSQSDSRDKTENKGWAGIVEIIMQLLRRLLGVQQLANKWLFRARCRCDNVRTVAWHTFEVTPKILRLLVFIVLPPPSPGKFWVNLSIEIAENHALMSVNVNRNNFLSGL